jgi:hypothetical protein
MQDDDDMDEIEQDENQDHALNNSLTPPESPSLNTKHHQSTLTMPSAQQHQYQWYEPSNNYYTTPHSTSSPSLVSHLTNNTHNSYNHPQWTYDMYQQVNPNSYGTSSLVS